MPCWPPRAERRDRARWSRQTGLAAAARLREIPTSRPHAHHADEKRRRSDGHRAHVQGWGAHAPRVSVSTPSSKPSSPDAGFGQRGADRCTRGRVRSPSLAGDRPQRPGRRRQTLVHRHGNLCDRDILPRDVISRKAGRGRKCAPNLAPALPPDYVTPCRLIPPAPRVRVIG